MIIYDNISQYTIHVHYQRIKWSRWRPSRSGHFGIGDANLGLAHPPSGLGGISRYTRPLEEVVSRIAKVWGSKLGRVGWHGMAHDGTHGLLIFRVHKPLMFGAARCFWNFWPMAAYPNHGCSWCSRMDPMFSRQDKDQTHILLEGNSAEMLPRSGPRGIRTKEKQW
jgi:hypothetical protein